MTKAARIAEQVTDRVHESVDAVTLAAAQGADLARDAAERAADTGNQWLDALAEQIARRPLASAAAAVAVGVILGRLMAGRRS